MFFAEEEATGDDIRKNAIRNLYKKYCEMESEGSEMAGLQAVSGTSFPTFSPGFYTYKTNTTCFYSFDCHFLCLSSMNFASFSARIYRECIQFIKVFLVENSCFKEDAGS